MTSTPFKINNKIQNILVSPEYSRGGDTLLRSNDGVYFNVHAALLEYVSPVFAGMLHGQPQGVILQLAEDSQMLSLVLGYIYPRPSPPITSFDMFNVAFRLAKRYGLETMAGLLRTQLVNQTAPVSIWSDPLRGLSLASAHELTNEATLATNLLSSTYDFRRVPDLLKLAEVMPQSRLAIKLVGVPSVRQTILVNVLFQYDRSPMFDTLVLPFGSFQREPITCSACQDEPLSVDTFRPPQWKVTWATRAFSELVNRPIEECDHVFEFRYLQTVVDELPGLEEGSCGCMKLLSSAPSLFEAWARDHVREELVERLAVVEQLNSLA